MNTCPSPMAAPTGAGPSARDPAPEVGSWLQGFIAFLLQLAGLLGQPGTRANHETAQALRALEDLIARHARGELLPHAHRPSRAPAPEIRARLPRAQRRILLVPGLHAALFFTPRAAIAARARIAAAAGRVTAARLAVSQARFSFFGPSSLLPSRALVVTLSYYS